MLQHPTVLIIVVLFSVQSYAIPCDKLLNNPDRQKAISAIQRGVELYQNPDTSLRAPVMFHGTSTEVVEKSLIDGGFIGGPAAKNSELGDQLEEIGERNVIFYQKVEEPRSVAKVITMAEIYADTNALEHFVLTQAGIGLEATKLFPSADLIWEDLSVVLEGPVSSKPFVEQLIAKFGFERLDDWIRIGRSRGGVVLIFKNRLGRKNIIEGTGSVGDEILLLEKPLPFTHVSAIIPTNAAAAERLELLKLRLLLSQ